MYNVAVIMSTTGRNKSWLIESINSINENKRDNINIDIFLHFDGCSKIELPCHISSSEKAIGLGDSMNKCLQKIMSSDIKYDFIARMDDDDIICSDKIEKQVLFMEKNSDIDFCSTLAQIIDENKNVVNAAWEYAKDNGKSLEERFLSGGCHIVHAATMFRANMLYDRGHLWYNPLFRQVEDYDLWFRLIKLGYKYKLLPEYLYKYRVHFRQETRSNGPQKEAICSKILGFYKSAWKDFLC